MIFTVGHSTLPESEFAALLLTNDVSHLIDIRSHPGSGYVPQHNRENLSIWAHEYGISYCWLPALGGWSRDYADYDPPLRPYGVQVYEYSQGFFPKSLVARKTRPMPPPPCWTNQGLYDYAFFTALDSFRSAAESLATTYADRAGPHCAIMCAEVLWWKCHRSMVADYLSHNLSTHSVHLQPHTDVHIPGSRIDRYPQVVRTAWSVGEAWLLRSPVARGEVDTESSTS